MHTATHVLPLRSRVTFSIAFALGLTISVAALGQDEQVEEKKSIATQIQELVAKLETQRAELDELTKKVGGLDDRAAAIIMEKEISQRREEFRREVDKQFSFGGSRSDREDAAIPIAWEDRKEAGFTEEELRELADISGSGPSRKTLMEAARILKERHLARQAAQGDTGEAA